MTKKDKKTIKYQFRMTEAQGRQFENDVKESGLSKTDYVLTKLKLLKK